MRIRLVSWTATALIGVAVVFGVFQLGVESGKSTAPAVVVTPVTVPPTCDDSAGVADSFCYLNIDRATGGEWLFNIGPRGIVATYQQPNDAGQ